MDMTKLTGSIVALITPFAADGSVDFEALERLVDFHLAHGTDGILVLGTTGESSTMRMISLSVERRRGGFA